MMLSFDCKRKQRCLKVFCVVSVLFLLVLWSSIFVRGEEYQTVPETTENSGEEQGDKGEALDYIEDFQQGDDLINALPDDTKEILNRLDIYGPDYSSLLDLDFQSLPERL